MVVAHVIRTVVPLCTPHIRADTVVEIDMGTQVITHSPNAIHNAVPISSLSTVTLLPVAHVVSRQSSVWSVITNFVYHRLASFPRFSLRYFVFLGEIRGQGRAGGEIRGGMVAVTHREMIWIREMKNTT